MYSWSQCFHSSVYIVGINYYSVHMSCKLSVLMYIFPPVVCQCADSDLWQWVFVSIKHRGTQHTAHTHLLHRLTFIRTATPVYSCLPYDHSLLYRDTYALLTSIPLCIFPQTHTPFPFLYIYTQEYIYALLTSLLLNTQTHLCTPVYLMTTFLHIETILCVLIFFHSFTGLQRQHTNFLLNYSNTSQRFNELEAQDQKVHIALYFWLMYSFFSLC